LFILTYGTPRLEAYPHIRKRNREYGMGFIYHGDVIGDDIILLKYYFT